MKSYQYLMAACCTDESFQWGVLANTQRWAETQTSTISLPGQEVKRCMHPLTQSLKDADSLGWKAVFVSSWCELEDTSPYLEELWSPFCKSPQVVWLTTTFGSLPWSFFRSTQHAHITAHTKGVGTYWAKISDVDRAYGHKWSLLKNLMWRVLH